MRHSVCHGGIYAAAFAPEGAYMRCSVALEGYIRCSFAPQGLYAPQRHPAGAIKSPAIKKTVLRPISLKVCAVSDD